MDLASSDNDLHSAAFKVAGYFIRTSLAPVWCKGAITGGTDLLQETVFTGLEGEFAIVVMGRIGSPDIHSLYILCRVSPDQIPIAVLVTPSRNFVSPFEQ